MAIYLFDGEHDQLETNVSDGYSVSKDGQPCSLFKMPKGFFLRKNPPEGSVPDEIHTDGIPIPLDKGLFAIPIDITLWSQLKSPESQFDPIYDAVD